MDAERLDIELPDPKDRIFYEVVMEKRKTEKAYLVTGNIRHFPAKPFVVTFYRFFPFLFYLISGLFSFDGRK